MYAKKTDPVGIPKRPARRRAARPPPSAAGGRWPARAGPRSAAAPASAQALTQRPCAAAHEARPRAEPQAPHGTPRRSGPAPPRTRTRARPGTHTNTGVQISISSVCITSPDRLFTPGARDMRCRRRGSAHGHGQTAPRLRLHSNTTKSIIGLVIDPPLNYWVVSNN
jgi:hypothetical protein